MANGAFANHDNAASAVASVMSIHEMAYILAIHMKNDPDMYTRFSREFHADAFDEMDAYDSPNSDDIDNAIEIAIHNRVNDAIAEYSAYLDLIGE